jgi:hypothetical protein
MGLTLAMRYRDALTLAVPLTRRVFGPAAVDFAGTMWACPIVTLIHELNRRSLERGKYYFVGFGPSSPGDARAAFHVEHLQR